MALAQSRNAKLKYVAEVTPGTTPAAALTLLRNTSSGLNLTIGTTTSQENTSTGDTADLVRTQGSSGGEIGFELSFAEYRPFVESALRGTFSTAFTLTATDISCAAADNSINSVAAAFSTANILPGHWIRVTGFTTNGAAFIAKVVSVTTAKIVVSHKTLQNEVAGASVTVKGRSVRNGTTVKAFSIEEEFTDLTTTFASYTGQIVNTMSINASSGAIVNGSFGLMGMSGAYGTATIGTGGNIAASTNSLMSATANVGTVFIDGTAVSGVYFKNINMTTNANARNQEAIGNLYPVGVATGVLDVKFAVSAFFSDTTLLTKFINGTVFTLSYAFYDADGNYIVIDAPRCKFDTGSLSGKQISSDIMQDLSITATRSTTLPYAIQISELG